MTENNLFTQGIADTHWFDNLNDQERAKVLSFTMGYLYGTANRTQKDHKEEIEKLYARQLLSKMKQYAYRLLEEPDQEKEFE